MYLNSVGSWSYVPKDACSSGLVQILQKEKTIRMLNENHLNLAEAC